jgi:hypothetical protein
VVCVKGVDNENASVLWQMMYSAQRNSSISGDVHTGLRSDHHNSTIRCLKNVPPSQIYNGLEIKKNEIKILVECAIIYMNSPDASALVFFFADGRRCQDVSFREAMGFFILNPEMKASSNSFNGSYFSEVVVFTPNLGLFNETPVSTHNK